MANVKISQLPAASTPLAGTELFEVVQSGVSSKVAASAIGNSATAIPFTSISGRAYISTYDTTDQTGSISAATAVKFGVTAFNSGITVENDLSSNKTRITYAASGTYMLAPSIQLNNADTSDHDVTFWFRKNGVNIPNSSTVVTVPKAGDGGSAFFQIVLYEQVTAGQYIEMMWLPENASVTLNYIASGALAPAAPSAIAVSERIA